MKQIFTILFSIFIVSGVVAQEDSGNNKKEKKEKKDKKEKKSKKKGKDKEDIFIMEPEGDKFKKDDRQEISKPSMPLYDVDQGFNQQKKKKKQQDAFNNKEYYFPAKPKNAWQIGLKGGIAMVNGDVGQNFFKGSKPFVPGYTFGAYVKKPFSYFFSLRAGYNFMEMWNTDAQTSTLTLEQWDAVPNLEDNYTPDYAIFHNSHTVSHEAVVDAMFSIGNMRFHKERSKVVFNFFVSAGAFFYQTWYDQLDANGNPYFDATDADLDGVGDGLYNRAADMALNGASKSDLVKLLNEERNGVFETQAESGGSSIGNYTFRPTFGGGAGMTFRLSRIIDLDFEGRIMFTRDDLVDGMQWEEPGAFQQGGTRGLTTKYDTYSTITLGLNFKLVGKKKTEPTTLLNPMHYMYQKLAENDPEEAINELLKDDDKDGVPNRLDEEEDTPEGAPVNPKGQALDSDSDGIIDLDDEEPFSPPGVPVNENGVAILPPVVDDIGSSWACEEVSFPSVHFDKNRYDIKPEFYVTLNIVAEKMMACPDMMVNATGMTDKDDNDKYNEQLSWNRVNEVIKYLNDNYGIDRNRFIVNFEGEANAEGKTKAAQYRERKVSLEPADASSGESNPAAPHPGIDAGVND